MITKRRASSLFSWILSISILLLLQGSNLSNSNGPLQPKEALLSGISQAISYSGFREGQHPARGDEPAINPTDEQVLEDLRILEPNFKIIRMYDSGENTETTLRLIKEHNIDIKVVVGAWLDAEVSNHENCDWLNEPIPEEVLKYNIEVRNPWQVANAIRLANEYKDQVIAVNVGNEILASWGDHMVTEEATIAYVKQVQAAIEQPVSVAETAEAVIDYKELSNTLDFLMVHTYPIWVGAKIEEGFEKTREDLEKVKSTYPDKVMVVGEVGWASEAKEFQERASEEYQKIYFDQIMDYGKKNNMTIFFFEAFDEPWKGDPNAPDGAEKHWGLYFVDRTPKLVAKSMN